MLLEERREIMFVEDTHPDHKEQFSAMVGAFKGAQKEIDAGFPLEAGLKTSSALKSIQGFDTEAIVGPEGMVLDPLEKLLEGFESDQDASDKHDISLTHDEFRRQADMVEFYLDHERYRIALECARELLVNRFLYDAGITEEWLNHEYREKITPAPGGAHDYFTHEVPEVQKHWDRISQARNSYAHAGPKRQRVTIEEDDETIASIETVCENIDNDSYWTS